MVDLLVLEQRLVALKPKFFEDLICVVIIRAGWNRKKRIRGIGEWRCLEEQRAESRGVRHTFARVGGPTSAASSSPPSLWGAARDASSSLLSSASFAA
jgi:hypothetical protein